MSNRLKQLLLSTASALTIARLMLIQREREIEAKRSKPAGGKTEQLRKVQE